MNKFERPDSLVLNCSLFPPWLAFVLTLWDDPNRESSVSLGTIYNAQEFYNNFFLVQNFRIIIFLILFLMC